MACGEVGFAALDGPMTCRLLAHAQDLRDDLWVATGISDSGISGFFSAAKAEW